LIKPPFNEDAEKAFLGALLLRNRIFDDVSGFLSPDDFYFPAHAVVYQAAARVIGEGRQATPVTLAGLTVSNLAIKDAGGIKFFTALTQSAVTVINGRSYAEVIHDLAVRRRLITDAAEIAARAADTSLDDPGADIAEEFQVRLADAALRPDVEKQLPEFSESALATIDTWESRARTGNVGLSYGLPSLDSQLGRMDSGDFILIGARPSMGKTALSRVIAYNVASNIRAHQNLHNGERPFVLYFSAEMAREKQIGAYLKSFSGVGAPVKAGPMRTQDVESLVQTATGFHGLPIHLDDTPGITLTQIKARARTYARRRGGLALIIVDYIQLMGIERGIRGDDENARITYLSRGLKSIARELKTPLIALSQLSRAVELRENKRPMLSDLRGSGTLEQDADVIAFIYRDEYYLERDKPKQHANEPDEKYSARLMRHHEALEKAEGKAEVIAGKVRIGAIGSCVLNWNGPRMWFDDPETESGDDQQSLGV